MVPVVVSPVINRDALRRKSVPRADVEWKQRRDRRTLVVAEVVLPHLTVVVGEPFRKRRRLRHQQQPCVLVGKAGEQDDLRRLEKLLSVADVGDACREPIGPGLDPQHLAAEPNIVAACFERDGKVGVLRAGLRVR